MRSQLLPALGLLLAATIAAPAPARAQISDLGKIIAKKDKDAADAVEKAGKGGPTAKTIIPDPPTARPRSATAAPSGAYDPDTEDPMSVLGITPELLARLPAGLVAEAARRDESPKLAAAKYDAVGAAVMQITPRQYFVLKQRVAALCEAMAKGSERPEDSRFAYMPAEGEAIKPECKSLLPVLQMLSRPAGEKPIARGATKKGRRASP
jgi:hypothetical protein